jgi:hypothetical protein
MKRYSGYVNGEPFALICLHFYYDTSKIVLRKDAVIKPVVKIASAVAAAAVAASDSVDVVAVIDVAGFRLQLPSTQRHFQTTKTATR